MSWLFKLLDSAGVNQAGVDSNNNVKVNLPTTPSQAGYGQTAYVANSSNAKAMQITEDGGVVNATVRPLLDLDFNGGSATWGTKINTNATTMTKAVANGYMRLNSGSSAATTVGISIYTPTVFNLFAGRELRVMVNIKHTNATATNKQMEWGIGYYNFAAGQANGMNEFIGFRITAGGVLQGVLAYSTGGAPTETTVTVNSGTPYTDGQSKRYEIRVTARKVEYWADGTLWNTIAIAADVYNILKGASYPFIARVFNSGAASAAPILDVGYVTVLRAGADVDLGHAGIAALQDRSGHYFQPDLLTGAGTNPMNLPVSGTGPTAATGSNTASVLNNAALIGGAFAMNAASVVITNNSNILISSYLNPAIPPANGAGNNGRNLIVTSIMVSPLIVTTAIAGQTGAWAAQWYAAVGGTAVSLATADADGTTAVAQKAHRFIPLSRVASFVVNAPAGTIETGVGDFTVDFPSPLVVHPGEYLSTFLRIVFAPTVVAASGVVQGSVYPNTYWE